MKYHILTLFPEMIEQGLHTSILGRAINNGYISLETTNIREFSANKFNRVDDYPYGGGAGMVMEAEPVFRAYQSVAEKIGKKPRTVYLTPQGKVLNQTMVEELALEDDLVLLCGHYEGIDDRVLQEVVTDYISIGDYVLTGGELGAMVLVDAVSRFVPGVLSNEESSQFESLQDNLLEYPHYTRPETWHEKKVPEVLLSGDHKKIEAWRHEASLVRTAERRPDLLENAFQISCACNEKEESSAWAHDLLAGMTRYGVSLDLGRKKIRKQKNLFDDHDLLILQLPGTLELCRKRNTAGVFVPGRILGRGRKTRRAAGKKRFPSGRTAYRHTVRGRPAAVFFRASQSAVQRRMESEKNTCICGCIIV